ncbi:hypothetical protein M0R72_15795 [Candidatus Pacearchaeota archaeon]|jgi:hypothetical protein|nr:hypothetical protein [Candidatus Pacearchaeota archaeon]
MMLRYAYIEKSEQLPAGALVLLPECIKLPQTVTLRWLQGDEIATVIDIPKEESDVIP